MQQATTAVAGGFFPSWKPFYKLLKIAALVSIQTVIRYLWEH